jgi:hypothetical protein
MFDTELLKWVTDCIFPKIQISDSQFSIPSIWRGNSLYVDTESSSFLELGTKKYPYKSLKSAMSEVLNHHSNQNKTLSVYLKENTTVYLEDGTNFLINITSVQFMTYSNTSSSSTQATIVGTRIEQSGDSPKSVFSILQDTSLKLNETIASSTLSSSEQALLFNGDVTLMIARCNVYISNVHITREIVDLGLSTIFMYVIYLQDKMVDIQDTKISVTGAFLKSLDPMNLNLQNIEVDEYGLTDLFFIEVSWNYPEAVLDSVITVDNMTAYESIERTMLDSAFLVYYLGPGNVTITNMHMEGKIFIYNYIKNFRFLESSNLCLDQFILNSYLINFMFHKMPEVSKPLHLSLQ